jgi:lipopolysaccharide export system protein LptC
MTVTPDTAAVAKLVAGLPRRAVVDRRYSRFVVLAKHVLAAIAVLPLVLVGFWLHLQTEHHRARFTLPRLDPREAQDSRVVDARYVGISRQGHPFVITADVAWQKRGTDGLISMEGPKCDLTVPGGHWLEVSARTAIYQPGPQILDLLGNVQLFQDKGNELHTDSAQINMANDTGVGHDPVEGLGPFGHITGQGFRLLDRGNTIVFTGHARLDLPPHTKDTP